MVKLGGHVLDSLEPDTDLLVALASDLQALNAGGSKVVVVHGGGPQIQSLLDTVDLPNRFVDGLRVTDAASLTYVTMALAEVNLRLVAALNASGLASVGLTGADRSTLRAAALGAPWGRVGGVPSVDAGLVMTLWASDVTPVVSSVAVDQFGGLLNCNADTVAGALAAALDADTLILLSDVDQLRGDPLDETTALAKVSDDDVRRLLESGVAREGMRPKMLAALDALEGGSRQVLIANGTRTHAVRDALAGAIPTTEVVASVALARATRGATPKGRSRHQMEGES